MCTQIDRHVDMQVYKQIGRLTSRYVCRQMFKTSIYEGSYIYVYQQICGKMDRQINKQIYKQIDTQIQVCICADTQINGKIKILIYSKCLCVYKCVCPQIYPHEYIIHAHIHLHVAVTHIFMQIRICAYVYKYIPCMHILTLTYFKHL